MRLKQAVLHVAKSLGAFALVRDSAWRRRRLLILCYHGVSMDDEHEWSPTLYVTQDHLRQRLRMLREGGYTILPLDEATRRLYEGTLPPRSVAITFDDGAVDFGVRAVPVLRELDAPATLYLTTYYSEHRLPVFNTILGYVLWKGRASGADVASLCHADIALPIATDEERKKAWWALHDYAAAEEMSAEEKNALVARVAARAGVDYDALVARGTLGIMSADAVRALPADLVDVQLHTHRHRTPRNRDLFLRELRDNAAVIHELRGAAPLEHFCYPIGDYHGEFLAWLRESNVRVATTCVPDLASPDSEPLLVPRYIDTMLQSPVDFESWVSGFAALLPKRRQYHLDQSRLTVDMVEDTRAALPAT